MGTQARYQENINSKLSQRLPTTPLSSELGRDKASRGNKALLDLVGEVGLEAKPVPGSDSGWFREVEESVVTDDSGMKEAQE